MFAFGCANGRVEIYLLKHPGTSPDIAKCMRTSAVMAGMDKEQVEAVAGPALTKHPWEPLFGYTIVDGPLNDPNERREAWIYTAYETRVTAKPFSSSGLDPFSRTYRSSAGVEWSPETTGSYDEITVFFEDGKVVNLRKRRHAAGTTEPPDLTIKRYSPGDPGSREALERINNRYNQVAPR